MLSRRLVLPALGALALMVSAGAVWQAEAQGSGFTLQITNATSPVASGGIVTVTGTASTNVGSITAITAQLGSARATVNNPGQTFSLQLKAPANNSKVAKNVKLTLTARRNAGNPRRASASSIITVNPHAGSGGGGGGGGGHDPNQPPPPPNI